MSFDWFVSSEDEFERQVGEKIQGFAEAVEEVKNLKRRRASPSKRRQADEEKRRRERAVRKALEEFCERFPSFYSKNKQLSLIFKRARVYKNSFEERFTREQYIKLQYERGEEIVESIKNLSLNGLYNLLKQPRITDISKFPPYSFFLQIIFTLATPYISRDDDDFYIIENPVRKDKVFKLPVISGSTWKGNMRSVARKLRGIGPTSRDDEVITRIFGNEKGEERSFRRGRLNFYPTFFEEVSLEVINPHDRKTKAGKNPVYIESVPLGAEGVFSLLYVPFDLLGKDEDLVKKEVAEDMRLICDSIWGMMFTYGFSAKKSAGFGVVEKLRGRVEFKFNDFNELRAIIDPLIGRLREEVESREEESTAE
jgi:CRISPR/Cas system CMR subunit Cmr6 (Cas7 group RAMP superfamily)